MDQKWEKRLRDRIEQSGLTMKAASLAAGLNETFVRDILERKRVPSIDKFIKLAGVLGTTVSDLLEEASDASRPIRDDAEIYAMLSRIEGLGDRGVELAMMTIQTVRNASREKTSTPTDVDGQSELATPRHEAQPSRQR